MTQAGEAWPTYTGRKANMEGSVCVCVCFRVGVGGYRQKADTKEETENKKEEKRKMWDGETRARAGRKFYHNLGQLSMVVT